MLENLGTTVNDHEVASIQSSFFSIPIEPFILPFIQQIYNADSRPRGYDMMMRDKGCDVVVVVQCVMVIVWRYRWISRHFGLCASLRVVRTIRRLHNGTSSPLPALLSAEEPTLLLLTTLSFLLLILRGKFTSNIIFPP